MKNTKKLALSAIMAALSVVFISLGELSGIAELAIAAFCSLIVVFIHAEVGSPYQYLLWITVSVLMALLFFGGFGWITYFLLFGIYPIIRHYIAKLPPLFGWVAKLVYFNIALIILMLVSELITGVPLFSLGEINIEGDNQEFIENMIKAGLYLLCNAAFVIYDIFLKVMIRFYFERLRARFARFLK
ncbi:MAG: hypothetical protein J6L90_00745 [Clostridia bacterium]|nr:hypothetical protein [Clostridia bacterium]